MLNSAPRSPLKTASGRIHRMKISRGRQEEPEPCSNCMKSCGGESRSANLLISGRSAHSQAAEQHDKPEVWGSRPRTPL